MSKESTTRYRYTRTSGNGGYSSSSYYANNTYYWNDDDFSAEELFNLFFGGAAAARAHPDSHHHHRSSHRGGGAHQQPSYVFTPSVWYISSFSLLITFSFPSILISYDHFRAATPFYFNSCLLFSSSYFPCWATSWSVNRSIVYKKPSIYHIHHLLCYQTLIYYLLNSKYTDRRITKEHQVPYFVRNGFKEDSMSRLELSKLERQVEDDLLLELRQNCFREKSYSKSNI